MKLISSLVATILAGLLCTGAQAVDPTTAASVDFSQGKQGWDGSGRTFIDPRIGNGAPALHTVFEDFGITYTNNRDAFTGDFSAMPSFTFALDVLVNSIRFDGIDVSRQLVVEFRDTDAAVNGFPYSSVWFDLGTIDALARSGWQHLSVTVADTGALALPPGWGGYGAEDAFGSPMLPAGVTFADILKGVDQLAITTLVPGFFYGFTDFDIAIDNISITPNVLAPVPEPSTLALMAGGAALLAWRRRRHPLA